MARPLIALLPGEGISPEIVAQARKVLVALQRHGFEADLEEAAVGGVAYERFGHPLPDATRALAQRAERLTPKTETA